MKPLWHRLYQSGIGDVVPAELLQHAVLTQHAAVDLLRGDHEIDWQGFPVHRGLRWMRAVAKLEIVTRSVHEVDARVLFAYGFAEAPKIEVSGSKIPWSGIPAGVPLRGWWLTWRLEEIGPQAVALGFETNGPVFPRNLLVFDAGLVNTNSNDRDKDRDGRGIAFLDWFDLREVGEDVSEQLSAFMLALKSITIAVR